MILWPPANICARPFFFSTKAHHLTTTVTIILLRNSFPTASVVLALTPRRKSSPWSPSMLPRIFDFEAEEYLTKNENLNNIHAPGTKQYWCGAIGTRLKYERRAQFFGRLLTPLEPQSRFGDKLLEIWVFCPQNGTAVLKGLRNLKFGVQKSCSAARYI